MLENVAPGPWTVQQHKTRWGVHDANGLLTGFWDDEASARLWAAAPEMALVLWALRNGYRLQWLPQQSEWLLSKPMPDAPMLGCYEVWEHVPDNGFNCPRPPPDLFARLWAEMEAGG